MKKQRLQHWILAADLTWVSIAIALAYVLNYGPRVLGSAADFFLFLAPMVFGVSCLWTIMFSAMKLDGFRRGWDFAAVVSQLFLGVCFLMTVLFASSYM